MFNTVSGPSKALPCCRKPCPYDPATSLPSPRTHLIAAITRASNHMHDAAPHTPPTPRSAAPHSIYPSDDSSLWIKRATMHCARFSMLCITCTCMYVRTPQQCICTATESSSAFGTLLGLLPTRSLLSHPSAPRKKMGRKKSTWLRPANQTAGIFAKFQVPTSILWDVETALKRRLKATDIAAGSGSTVCRSEEMATPWKGRLSWVGGDLTRLHVG